jgi:hypothetical protein
MSENEITDALMTMTLADAVPGRRLPDLGGPVDVEPNGKMLLVRVLLRQPLTTEAGLVAELKDKFPTVRVMRVGDEVTRYAPGDQVQVRGGEGDVEINGHVYGWTSEAQVICKVLGDDPAKLIEGISPSEREAYLEHQKRKEEEAQQKALMQRQLMTAGRSAPPHVMGRRH